MELYLMIGIVSAPIISGVVGLFLYSLVGAFKANKELSIAMNKFHNQTWKLADQTSFLAHMVTNKFEEPATQIYN